MSFQLSSEGWQQLSAEVTSSGIDFQLSEPATEKARLPPTVWIGIKLEVNGKGNCLTRMGRN